MRPNCFGSNPSYQDQAEYDCIHCTHCTDCGCACASVRLESDLKERNAAKVLNAAFNSEHRGAALHDHGPQDMINEAMGLVRRSDSKANDKQCGGTHYKDMGVQPWDVVDTWPREQRIGYYRGGALKYLMRMGSKDENAQEIAKGQHYLEKLLEVLTETRDDKPL